MREPHLTFAIPFYSGVEYLKRCLESVVAQTRNEWSCVIYDDGDRSSEREISQILSQIGNDRIRYSRNAVRRGMAGNWNQCLENCKTEFLTILHADDELLPGYCDEMMTMGARFPEAATFFCAAEIINADSRLVFSPVDAVKWFFTPRCGPYIVVEGDVGLARLTAGNFIMCPTACFKMKHFRDLRFSERWKFTTDWNFYVDILTRGYAIIGTKKVCYRYRRHSEQLTSQLTKSSLRFAEEFATLRRIREESAKLNWSRSTLAAKRHVATPLHLALYGLIAVVKFDWRYLGSLTRILWAHYFSRGASDERHQRDRLH